MLEKTITIMKQKSCFSIRSDIVVKTQQNKKMVEVKIKEGEMFLLPAKIPHSPVRPRFQLA